MRLVTDTNVFVSAALNQASSPADTVRWIEAHGGLLKSHATEQEVVAVLQRPRIAARIPQFVLANVLRIFAKAELVTITERIIACRDAKDDKFLELAVNGRADVIVTGDLDLLAPDRFRGIPVVSPSAFVSRP